MLSTFIAPYIAYLPVQCIAPDVVELETTAEKLYIKAREKGSSMQWQFSLKQYVSFVQARRLGVRTNRPHAGEGPRSAQ